MFSQNRVIIIGGGALALETARALITMSSTISVTIFAGGQSRRLQEQQEL